MGNKHHDYVVERIDWHGKLQWSLLLRSTVLIEVGFYGGGGVKNNRQITSDHTSPAETKQVSHRCTWFLKA